MTRWLATIVLFAIILIGPRALAQGGYRVQLSAGVRRVEVNAPFRVTLTAVSGGDDAVANAPTLSRPAGIVVLGQPSIGTQQQISIAGGRTVIQRGIRVTWTLRATKAGHFTIGPASVALGGKRVSSNPISIEAVPAGQGGARTRQPPWGLLGPPGWPSPFDLLPDSDFPFGPGASSPLDDDAFDPDALPPYPRELAIDRATDPVAFLDATATPRRVVVGEPTTFRIVAYGRRGRFTEGRTTEPAMSSFISYPVHDTSYGLQSYQVPIDDDVWWALMVREIVLYPVDTGTLTIGPMKMEFVTPRGRPYLGAVTERSSPAVKVVVTEPPPAGRPTGYVLGDVGRFSLKASVEPREVDAGQAVSVVVKVEGAGNFPSRLRTPQQKGVEWLDPTVTEDTDLDAGRLGGTKHFSYVVRLQKAGVVDLGQIELPYWDPVRRIYDTARVNLGNVRVSPGAMDPLSDDEAIDRLATLIEPRTELGPNPRQPLRWGDRPWFWMLLAMGPIGVVVAAGAARVGSGLTERWRSQRQSLGTRAAKAMNEARRAAHAGDLPATANAGERALFLEIEAATGIKARGVLRDDLRRRLLDANLGDDLVREVDAVLASFDAVRFTGATDVAPSALIGRTQTCVGHLRRVRCRRRPT